MAKSSIEVVCNRVVCVSILAVALQLSANAQARTGQSLPDDSVPVTTSAEVAPGEKLKRLQEELQEQKKSLEEMRTVIREQQRQIELLLGKSAAVNTAAATIGEATVPSPSASTGQPQPEPLEARIKKLEGKVLSFGPFRFSGDFRLRFDGIFRRAEPNPPAGFAPLTHQQNARARYRLRLNFDTDINSKVSFHGQLTTGPVNNPLTSDQDFAAISARHPFFISEAWIDYHPNQSLRIQAGRLQEVFADNSRFLFDDDIRFNGFNEKYVWSFKPNGLKVAGLEFRAGQYILSNPNVAIVTAGSPLALAGDRVGTSGRAANLFHQGVLANQKFNEQWSGQLGGDIQIYRNPNQIQLASTAAGVPLIVQNGLGIALSGPLTGTGNATTTAGGAAYTAPSFKIARITYRLSWAGWRSGTRAYPVVFDIQASRNVGIGLPERDALLASFQIGKVAKRGDVSFLYVFSTKGANSMISQVTDDDLGTNSGVNIRTHHLRFDYGIARRITLQSLLYIQTERRSSGDFPNFFVPLHAFTPRQYRLQEQIVFTF